MQPSGVGPESNFHNYNVLVGTPKGVQTRSEPTRCPNSVRTNGDSKGAAEGSQRRPTTLIIVVFRFRPISFAPDALRPEGSFADEVLGVHSVETHRSQVILQWSQVANQNKSRLLYHLFEPMVAPDGSGAGFCVQVASGGSPFST